MMWYRHVLFAVVLVGLGAPPGVASTTLVLTGSSTIAPLALELGKRFEKANPSLRVDVQTGGSSRGVADTRRGLASIGMASRSLKDGESDLRAWTIAWDGVGLVVHRDNPVTSLSRAQTIGIFRGHIDNWKAVGGRDEKIVVVNRAAGRSELEIFLAHYDLKPFHIKAAMVVGENAHGMKTIANNRRAITFLSVGHTLAEAKLGTPVKVLPLAGVAALPDNIRNGSFPLARPLNLLTKGPVDGIKQRFIEFAMSERNYDLVQGQSFIPADPAVVN